MKAPEHERRDWLIVFLILLFGLFCILISGQWALRFAPSWRLNANMQSQLDPNSEFLTRRPNGLIEPVDQSILTQPVWIDVFLTPGAIFPTRAIPPATRTAAPAGPTTTPSIIASVTNVVVITNNPTNAIIYIPPSPTATPRRATSTPVSSGASSTPALVSTFTPTSTLTTLTPITASPTQTPTSTPPVEIGTSPDGITYDLHSGGTLTLSINLVVNGHAGWDLVYYELPAGSGILLDWVIIEVGDGTNWYPILNWGNNVADTNTNVDFNILSNPQSPPEPDQRDIPSAELYNSTGVAIDLDSVVPAGMYSYIRFYAPPGDVDGQLEIDAIEILP